MPSPTFPRERGSGRRVLALRPLPRGFPRKRACGGRRGPTRTLPPVSPRKRVRRCAALAPNRPPLTLPRQRRALRQRRVLRQRRTLRSGRPRPRAPPPDTGRPPFPGRGRPTGRTPQSPPAHPPAAAPAPRAWSHAASSARRTTAPTSGDSRPRTTIIPSSSTHVRSDRVSWRRRSSACSAWRSTRRHARTIFSTWAAVPDSATLSRSSSVSGVATRVTARIFEYAKSCQAKSASERGDLRVRGDPKRSMSRTGRPSAVPRRSATKSPPTSAPAPTRPHQRLTPGGAAGTPSAARQVLAVFRSM